MIRKRVTLSGETELKKLAIADLKRSGLTANDYKTLQLEVMTAQETKKFVGEDRASYKIPYFNLAGERTAFARVRFIESRYGRAFRKQSSFRYSQPFNSSPHIYYAPYLDWKAIAKDPSWPILITEGEKKAAKACREGIACIALGGVYAFKSSKRQQNIIPDFDDIVWNDREIEICYDADVMLKAEVRQALEVIAQELNQRYSPASINFVDINAETMAGPKTGLDDYLIAHGREGFDSLPRRLYQSIEMMQEINERICFVEKHHLFYDKKVHNFFKSFQQLRESFMNMGEIAIDGGKRTALVIDLWARNKNRSTVRDVVYSPGKPEVTERNDFNIWIPPRLRPKRGDPRDWLEMVHHVYQGFATWFMQWLAYPVQHPGAKLLQAVFVHGAQGVGKTFIVDPVMEFVYGPHNFYRLSNDDIQDRFNAYASHTQFVVTNEIYFSNMRDRRMIMSGLKDSVTREKVTVNEKFQPKMTYRDHCNYYLTSNHADALVLDPDDRRFFVVEAPSEKLDLAFYGRVDEYVRNGGTARIMNHLLNDVDCSTFNPKGDALFTPHKEAVIGLSKDVFTEYMEKISFSAQTTLMHNGMSPDQELYTADDIMKKFSYEYPRYYAPITMAKVGHALINNGIERRRVRMSADEPQMVLYAILNRDEWHKAKNKDWAAHYQKENRRLYGSKLN